MGFLDFLLIQPVRNRFFHFLKRLRDSRPVLFKPENMDPDFRFNQRADFPRAELVQGFT